MYVKYISISVILLIIGLVSAVYFLRFLKNTNFHNVTIPAISESLNTFLIGIFYLYCAIVITQQIGNAPMPMEPVENDIVIIEQDENAENSATNYTYPNQDFLKNYQHFLFNVINKQNKKEKKYEEKTKNKEPNTTYSESDCFRMVFMENSMFLYSFLHSVVSLLLHANPDSESKPKPKANEDTENKLVTANAKQRFFLILKILTIFLTPMICILTFYFLLYFNMNPVEISFDPTLWNFIKPLNISSTGIETHQINDVVNNIYTIVNATRNSDNSYTRRKPKQLEACTNAVIMFRVYIMLVFVFYLLTILYAKMKQIEARKTKFGKQLNISILSFALLWIFTVLEMVFKTYFLGGKTSSLLTEVFLTMGNLNQLSIIVMNYLKTKETMKKYNLVEPKA